MARESSSARNANRRPNGRYLPRLQWPIRTGVHPDTAFALAQTLDYARIVGNQELEKLIVDKGRQYYLADKDYNASMEPSGEDSLLPSLNEADFFGVS